MKVVYDKSDGMRVPIKIWGDIDENTLDQAKNIARLPFIHKWVALMPDNHYGFGVPIGSVIPCDGYVIPNAVGSDIGCGMVALKLKLTVDDISVNDVDKIFTEIQRVVPVGFHDHKNTKNRNLICKDHLAELFNRGLKYNRGEFPFDYDKLVDQLGTLGSGNHFLELQKDEDGNLWLMIHSGSRNYGAQIATIYHKKALEMCKKYHSVLPCDQLAYLPIDTELGRDYIFWMNSAKEYARINRFEMLLQAVAAVDRALDKPLHSCSLVDAINIPHNYATIENHFGKNVFVHRKGATCARNGQIGIIPGSMCTQSHIVRGKGYKDALMSCSHGSGRRFSRNEARQRVLDGVDAGQNEQLNSVKLYGVENASDELGSAYKDIVGVMDDQTDMVDIIETLTPLGVLKG